MLCGQREGLRRTVSVPLLWDTMTGRIVSNNFPDIFLDLGTQFREWATTPEVDLYPDELRTEIDAPQ